MYALIRQLLAGHPPEINHPLEGQRVYQTVFDGTGQFDLLPLGKIRLQESDLVRKIYRSMWLTYTRKSGDWTPSRGNESFSDILIKSFREWTECFSIDCGAVSNWLLEARKDLADLELLVKKGMALLDQAGQTLAASFNGEVLRKLAAEIGPIDEELRRVGKSRIWTSQLTSFFDLDLEQAQGTDFMAFLRVWQDAYREMRSRIRFLQNQIDIAEELILD
jgi:hypothetical protein